MLQRFLLCFGSELWLSAATATATTTTATTAAAAAATTTVHVLVLLYSPFFVLGETLQSPTLLTLFQLLFFHTLNTSALSPWRECGAKRANILLIQRNTWKNRVPFTIS